MSKQASTFLLSVLMVLASMQATAATVAVLGADIGEIYEVEIGTGVIENALPPVLFLPGSGIAYSRDSDSYLVSSPFSGFIDEIDRSTGNPIGGFAAPVPSIGGMDFEEDPGFYGFSPLWVGDNVLGSPELYAVDPIFGGIIDVVPLWDPAVSPAPLIEALAVNEFGEFFYSDPNSPFAGASILHVDRFGNLINLLPNPGFDVVTGLSFTSDGSLLVGSGFDIYEIDPIGGGVLSVTSSPVPVGGLAFVPEPGTALLLGLGLVGLASRRGERAA